MNAFRFAIRLLQRDWRSRELRLLSVALIVAVAAVTAVGFFTDRIRQAMELQATELLAADLVIESTRPIPPEIDAEARRLGLQTAETLSFPSVVLYQDTTQLVQVKAVTDNYPLRGRLRIAPGPYAPERTAFDLPSSGSAWAEPRLFATLGIAPGAVLSLGERGFSVDAALTHEPDRGWRLFQLAPRMMIRMQDVAATELVSPNSRVKHRMLVAGETTKLAGFRAWIKTRLSANMSLVSVDEARPEMRNALDRSSRFLSLAAIVSVLVAGAAVALATNRFVETQADASALFRCLGATRRLVLRVFALRLAGVALIASLIGCLVGYFAQSLLADLVGQWFTRELPAPSLTPVLVGLATGAITLAGFALPPLLRLGKASPLRVLRHDLKLSSATARAVFASAAVALATLILWQANDLKLAGWMLLGILLTIVALAVIARSLVYLLTPIRRRAGNVWRFGLANLVRAPRATLVQLVGFGVGILAMLILAIVRVDLLDAWQRSLPEKAPNYFLVNIQPDEVDMLGQFLANEGIESSGLFPMQRARLTHRNAQPLSVENFSGMRAQRFVQREYNLSWSLLPPPDNRVLEGNWWTSEESALPLLSVEKEWAESMRVKTGDTLSFELAGESVTGRVSNIRQVRWDSFNPNFFVMGTPGLLHEYPTTYITSFYLSGAQLGLGAALVKEFPSVTLIDVSSILRNIRDIMNQGAKAVEYIFVFTLLTGLIVLYASIQANRETRIQESAILRTLGWTRRQILMSVAAEFMLLGLLAGVLASVAASLIGYVVIDQVFQLDYQFNSRLLLVGILGGMLGIGLAGVLAANALVIKPPLELLRQT